MKSIINQEKGHTEPSTEDIYQVCCYNQRGLVLS